MDQTERIAKLDSDIKELLENRIAATEEAVEAIHNELNAVKGTFFSVRAPLKSIQNLIKFKMHEKHLKQIKLNYIANSKLKAQEKAIGDLQKRGFYLPMTKDACIEAFTKAYSHLKTLGCESVFTINHIDREKAVLQQLVFSCDGTLKSTFMPLEAAYSPPAGSLPLGQLQDVSAWLERHGMPLVGLDAIEKRLESLIHACPHGAYVLHTHNKELTLSRVTPLGQIEHIVVNLINEPGSYTLELTSGRKLATRTQFKRRLEQMGTPIKLYT